MNRPPTARQREVLAAIYRLTEPRGPTVRELCAALGVSSMQTAHRHIEALQARGLVTKANRFGESRGVIVTDRGLLELQRKDA